MLLSVHLSGLENGIHMRANNPRGGGRVMGTDMFEQRDMILIGLHGTPLDG